MGSTGYPAGMTAAQAKAEEFRGCEILHQSGNWTIARTEKDHIGLWYQKTWGNSRSGVCVKTMHIKMGPGVPPKGIAKQYLEYYNGDADEAGGTYGADDLRKALEGPQTPTLRPGDKVHLRGEWEWSDGVPQEGTYVFLKGYRFRRFDGITCRFAKNWKQSYKYTWERA